MKFSLRTSSPLAEAGSRLHVISLWALKIVQGSHIAVFHGRIEDL